MPTHTSHGHQARHACERARLQISRQTVCVPTGQPARPQHQRHRSDSQQPLRASVYRLRWFGKNPKAVRGAARRRSRRRRCRLRRHNTRLHPARGTTASSTRRGKFTRGRRLAVTKFVDRAVFDAPDIPGGRGVACRRVAADRTDASIAGTFCARRRSDSGRRFIRRLAEVINRQALHAFYLAFPAVGSGERAPNFSRLCPIDFKAALRRFSADAANGIDALLYNFKFLRK